jgi:hypothetical protein
LRAVVLYGGPPAGFARDVEEALVALLEEAGVDVLRLSPGELAIAGCLGCFGCWVRTPGECVLDDDGRRVARAVIQSDVTAFVTPVTFGGYSSSLKAAVDRLIPLGSPFFQRVAGETHHRRRYARYPRLLGVGTLAKPDAEAAGLFCALVGRNALNLHAPVHGAGVLSEAEHGNAPSAALQSLLGRVGVRP